MQLVGISRLRNGSLSMDDALARTAEHGFSISTIIDIGAAEGRWTEMALRHFPAAHVLAFEPLAERREPLERLKRRLPKFDFVNAAAGATKGEIAFCVADDLDGSGVSSERNPSSRLVPTTSIDAEVQFRRLPAPYLIKLDTHGFEVPILDGARQTLKETSVVVVEVYNFRLSRDSLRFHEMCSHLESLGFRCFDLADPMLRPRDKALWQADMLFAKRESSVFNCEDYV